MRIHRRPAFSLTELLIVIAIIALLIGLTLAAVQRVRMSAARAKCANQLRQIALALHHHHDVHLAFPPGVSNFDGKSPQPFMSWLTRLLPYLEQDALWRQSLAAFDKEKFFENPPHTAILGTKIDLFVCPTDPFTPRPADIDDISAAHTNYLGVSGADLYSRDGILHADSRVTFASITDGPSNTLMVGERGISNPIFGWWYAGWGQAKTGSTDSLLGVRERLEDTGPSKCAPGPYRFRAGSAKNRCDSLRFWSHHPGGAHFAFGDASVRFLSYSADNLLPALATRAGGESVESP